MTNYPKLSAENNSAGEGNAIEPRNLATSGGARAYVADYFALRLQRHDFNRYIKDTLAADFACALAQHLAGLEAQQDASAAQTVRIQFPTHLRKMWSGSEVQAWLDKQTGTPQEPVTAKGSLARYRKWQAAQAVPDERDAFEAWIRGCEGHPFAGQFANLMWKAWQARAAIAAKEAP